MDNEKPLDLSKYTFATRAEQKDALLPEVISAAVTHEVNSEKELAEKSGIPIEIIKMASVEYDINVVWLSKFRKNFVPVLVSQQRLIMKKLSTCLGETGNNSAEIKNLCGALKILNDVARLEGGQSTSRMEHTGNVHHTVIVKQIEELHRKGQEITLGKDEVKVH